ncbi:hypothetical protein [Affinirhizobium pseudoryzae]|uniref:hypothetical protein n=1 Tax=Allorhizobium pseudoryzae TaxID=379684 RepID=UPI0013EB0FAF|nr:hypothetical protein [Allorhizobium pseudoryzae]
MVPGYQGNGMNVVNEPLRCIKQLLAAAIPAALDQPRRVRLTRATDPADFRRDTTFEREAPGKVQPKAAVR